jgi:hypothetical protein
VERCYLLKRLFGGETYLSLLLDISWRSDQRVYSRVARKVEEVRLPEGHNSPLTLSSPSPMSDLRLYSISFLIGKIFKKLIIFDSNQYWTSFLDRNERRLLFDVTANSNLPFSSKIQDF